MKIIGIDPGYDRLGIAIIDKPTKGKEVVIYSNCFTTSSKDDIHERLKQIGQEISRVLDEFQPDQMAIENLFLSKNQKTAMRVSEARGIIIYEGLKRNIPIHEYSPMQIKTSITSDGTSDKERIIKMVKILVDLPNKKAHDDEYDAIAVALTCSAMLRPSRV
jgi:crossover junction endodeoxyribonuclease RuvC